MDTRDDAQNPGSADNESDKSLFSYVSTLQGMHLPLQCHNPRGDRSIVNAPSHRQQVTSTTLPVPAASSFLVHWHAADVSMPTCTDIDTHMSLLHQLAWQTTQSST